MATLRSPVRVLAIDPGNVQSAYVLMDRSYRPLRFGKIDNEQMRETIGEIMTEHALLGARANGQLMTVIEMVASYGMAVGKTVFETCVWIGRYMEIVGDAERMFRQDVKLNLCGQKRAKDTNIRRALIDRFAVHDLKNGKGTKKDPDWFYGFHDDIWSAYAVGVTYLDKIKEEAEW